jgi:hypothetical protein
MIDEPQIADFSRVIQLAVAPVLTAVGTLLAVLTNRLARSVDRRRILEDRFGSIHPSQEEAVRAELGLLARRIRLVLAISLAVLCAIFVCLLIAGAFFGAFVAVDLARLVAITFVLAMIALIGSLLVFLREIVLAVRTPRRVAAPADARSGDGEIARR